MDAKHVIALTQLRHRKDKDAIHRVVTDILNEGETLCSRYEVSGGVFFCQDSFLHVFTAEPLIIDPLLARIRLDVRQSRFRLRIEEPAEMPSELVWDCRVIQPLTERSPYDMADADLRRLVQRSLNGGA